jgi:homogentisate solanesyltransferase
MFLRQTPGGGVSSEEGAQNPAAAASATDDESSLNNNKPAFLVKIRDTANVAYRFSRPHTIKGTILASLVGVIRALRENPGSLSMSLVPRALTGLVALLCGNAYIVGINQIYDVGIDKINKPFLPIASDELSILKAWMWVLGCLVVGGSIVKTQFSPLIFQLYGLGGFLGTIYSVPPFSLKRFPVAAGGIIAIVRGFLLNFGVYYAVREALHVPFQWNPVVLFISTFMTIFASIIAVTKDLPDVKGDVEYNIETFASKFGVPVIAKAATAVLCTAYLGAMLLAVVSSRRGWAFKLLPMVGGHAALMVSLLLGHRKLVASGYTQDAIKHFYYKSVWNVFYLEYILYPFI